MTVLYTLSSKKVRLYTQSNRKGGELGDREDMEQSQAGISSSCVGKPVMNGSPEPPSCRKCMETGHERRFGTAILSKVYVNRS